MELNTKYHKPDTIWNAIWKYDSHDKFMAKIFIQGKFHKAVPPAIVKGFKTVEKLLEFSYYHYPLLDEALSKSLRLFEGAVNIRLQQLGYDVDKYRTLGNKLQVLKKHSSETFYQFWDEKRERRNMVEHAKPETLMGITAFRRIIQMVNALNTLFLEKETIISIEKNIAQLSENMKGFQSKAMVLESENKLYLIRDVFPSFVYQNGNVEKQLWTLYPVLKEFPTSIQDVHNYSPIFLRMYDVIVSASKISGFLIGSKMRITITLTEDSDILNTLKNHKELLETSPDTIWNYYFHIMRIKANEEIVSFMYEECWQ